jgi:hypothetical protein
VSESCVCCQATAAKASGVNATLVLLFTLAGDRIAPANIIEALCKKHGAKLDSMIYRSLVPQARKWARQHGPPKHTKKSA